MRPTTRVLGQDDYRFTGTPGSKGSGRPYLRTTFFPVFGPKSLVRLSPERTSLSPRRTRGYLQLGMNHLAVRFSGYSVAGKFVPTRGDRLRIIGWGARPAAGNGSRR
jgi:hypothetical protein